MTDEVLTVDCSGLSCPEPALAAKRALTSTQAERVEVLVDSSTSRDNVLRTGVRAGWTGEAEERDGGGFRVVFRR
ncbi:MAG: sulfurtransferase TusA family protein [Thermoleophilia bacterium]|nr:sulfurtransferase TusA family protein [Thermoleophilia bacterium]